MSSNIVILGAADPEMILETSDTSTTRLPRHIVARQGGFVGSNEPDGGLMGRPLQDRALCGALWDRANATSGKLCETCVAIYRRRHPGLPLPG